MTRYSKTLLRKGQSKKSGTNPQPAPDPAKATGIEEQMILFGQGARPGNDAEVSRAKTPPRS